MASGAISLGRGINIIRAGGGSSGGALDTDARAYCDNALIFGQTPIAYDNAASFNGTNQYLSRASNSTLQIGGTNFAIAGWAIFPSASSGMVVSKSTNPGGANLEFEFEWNFTSGLFFSLSNGASYSNVNIPASSVPKDVWTFYVIQYNAGTYSISLNNGAATASGALAFTPWSSNGPFVISSRGNGTNYFLRTSQAGIGLWKRVLTSDEISRLYNGGLGLPYDSFDSALKSFLVSYWRLNDTADSQGTNTLTNNGSVTFNTLGPVATLYDNARSLINSFVLGIKGLGLWSNMVCWPLRASQNASSTLTAYSLGGLATRNGTLGGSTNPVYSSDGLTFATSQSNYITFSDTTFGSYPFMAAFVSLNASGDTSPIFGKSVAGGLTVALNQYENILGINGVTGGPGGGFSGFSAQNANIFMSGRGISSTQYLVSANGGAETTLTGTTPQSFETAPFNRIAGRRGGLPTKIAFALACTNASASTPAAIYPIYKSTIGQGLGLP